MAVGRWLMAIGCWPFTGEEQMPCYNDLNIDLDLDINLDLDID